MTSIGDYAFRGCSGLTGTMELPSGITSIPDRAFEDCSSLTGIKLPSGITSIPSYAFSGCSGLTGTMELPSGITSISDRAFEDCSSLTGIELPSGITNIGYHTFRGCSGLKKVTVPGTVAEIAYDTFSGCTVLESVVLEEGVKKFDAFNFEDCKNMKQLTIPKSVEKIDDERGNFWKDIPNLTIFCYENSPAHKYAVEHKIQFQLIGDNHVHDKVIDPAIPATCTKEGKTQGSHCSVCGQVIEKQQTIPKKAHTYQASGTVKASMGKDGSIKKKCSVCGTTDSTVIYAPKNISFSKTSYFYNGKVQSPKVIVKDRKGKALREKTDYKVSYPKGRKNIASYTVKVTFKGNYTGTANAVFKISAKKGTGFTSGACKYKVTGTSTVAVAGLKNKKTTKVNIPKKVSYGGKSFQVTSIADKSFQKSKLKEVQINDNIKTIGASAFEGSANLLKVTIGKNTASIGRNTFKGCKRLKTVVIQSAKLKSVGANAFKGIYKNAKIKVPKKKLAAYKKLLKGKGQGNKVKITK